MKPVTIDPDLGNAQARDQERRSTPPVRYVHLEPLTRSASGQWHRMSADGSRLLCINDQPRDHDRRLTLRQVDWADLCPTCFADVCECGEHGDERPCPYWCGVHGRLDCDEHEGES